VIRLGLADEDRADLHAPAMTGFVTGAKVGRPEELRGGTQRDTEAERAADLGEHGRLQQPPDDPKCANIRQGRG
jgi:hypothetical protein